MSNTTDFFLQASFQQSYPLSLGLWTALRTNTPSQQAVSTINLNINASGVRRSIGAEVQISALKFIRTALPAHRHLFNQFL